jgi:hypothetical protein
MLKCGLFRYLIVKTQSVVWEANRNTQYTGGIDKNEKLECECERRVLW